MTIPEALFYVKSPKEIASAKELSWADSNAMRDWMSRRDERLGLRKK